MAQEGEFTEHERSVPRYDLSPEEVARLTHSLLEKRAGNVPEERRFVAIEVQGDSEYANIGRFIEGVVFQDAFGNSSDEMVREYSAYESASTFFLSVDRITSKATGVLRVIKNSEAGLKSYDDAVNNFGTTPEKIATHPGMDDMNRVWDVGTIAVLPEFRGKDGPVSMLLQRAVYKSALDHDIPSLISIVDKKALTRLRSRWRGVGIPFKSLGGAKAQSYLGSGKSYPVHGHVPDFYPTMDKERNSLRGKLLARFVLGNAVDRLLEDISDDAIVFEETYKN